MTATPARDTKAWFGTLLRDLRKAKPESIAGAEARTGYDRSVIGSYERKTRTVDIVTADALLGHYDMELAAVPQGTDLPALLAELEQLRKFKEDAGQAMKAAGLDRMPDQPDGTPDDGERYAV